MGDAWPPPRELSSTGLTPHQSRSMLLGMSSINNNDTNAYTPHAETNVDPPPYATNGSSAGSKAAPPSSGMYRVDANKSTGYASVSADNRRNAIIAGVCCVVVCLAIILGTLGGLGYLSPSSSSSGPAYVYVTGNVTTADGTAVSGATVTSYFDGGSTTTSSGGLYTTWAPCSGGRYSFWVNKSGYLPQIAAGSLTDAQTYAVNVIVTPIGSTYYFSVASGTTVTYQLSMSHAEVTVPPNAVSSSYSSAYLRLTMVMPGTTAPGQLSSSTTNQYGGNSLQSAGMLYVDVSASTTGSELTLLKPIQVSFVYDLNSTADSIEGGSMMAWSMGSDGLWSNPTSAATRRRDSASSSRGYFSAPRPTYVNADRAIRTGCVRGTLVNAAGSSSGTCPGAYVSTSSFYGTMSTSSSSASGQFCLTGAVGSSTSVNANGYFVTSAYFSTSGSCSSPSTCTNLGNVVIPSRASLRCPPRTAPSIPTTAPPTTRASGSASSNSAECSYAQSYINSYTSYYSGYTTISCCVGYRFTYSGYTYQCSFYFPVPTIAYSTCSSYISALTSYNSYLSGYGYSITYYGC